MRRLAAAGTAALLLAAGAIAAAAPPLRITSLRILGADGRTPATQPLRRGTKYVYRLDYRVGGRRAVRVRRQGTFFSPYGDRLVEIRPPVALADPGRLFATGPIRIGRTDSPGEYRLAYLVSARDSTGATRRSITLPIRFR